MEPCTDNENLTFEDTERKTKQSLSTFASMPTPDQANKSKEITFARLLCTQCNAVHVCSRRTFPFFEKAFYESLSDTATLWDFDTINVFGILKYHQFHGNDIIFMDSRKPLPTHIDELAQIDQQMERLPIEVRDGITSFFLDYQTQSLAL